MADGVLITAGAGTTVLTDDTGAGGHAQVVKLAIATDASATLIPADGTDGLLVNLGANNDVTVTNTVAVGSHAVTNAGTFAVQAAGTTAHGGAEQNPQQIGLASLAHGTNPSQVAAGLNTKWYANRHGVPWVIGGHPNVLTLKHANITTAVTDTAIITVGTGVKVVVTRLTVTLDNASTVFPTVLIGFGTVNTPTTTGVLAAHGGVPAGGGFTIGDGSGILGVGADDADLRITTTGNATGNGLQVTVSYYTIES